MERAQCCEKVRLKWGRWTAEEDEILTKYILANGEGSWRSLPKNAGLLRCGKSCRLRWVNYLRADVKRGNISSQEEQIMINLHAVVGNRWSVIASKLPGRTDNEIKNYWNTHLRQRVDSVRMLPVVDKALLALIESVKVDVSWEKKEGGVTRREKVKDHRTITVPKQGVGISEENESSGDNRSRSRVSHSSSVDIEKVIAPSMNSDNDSITMAANGENHGSSKGINDSGMVSPGGYEKSHEGLGPMEGIDEEMLSAFNEIMDSSELLVDCLVSEWNDCNLANLDNIPLSPGNYISSCATGLEETQYFGSSTYLSVASPSLDGVGTMSRWHLEGGVDVGCDQGEQMFSWLWEDDHDMEDCQRDPWGVIDPEKYDEMVRWLLSED
ncbi:hypothetical protein SAY87_020009 [Trapa incisa]|uniref:Uncharacterized protein n=1 Tax=Trapa incisa TaxID=236973 RepID=A0AAN7K6P7_9MYRT|nr:hypothetical protein SAY87_020009 [Trapa incisa]